MGVRGSRAHPWGLSEGRETAGCARWVTPTPVHRLWGLKLRVTCPPQVGVMGCEDGGDFPSPGRSVAFSLALGPGNYSAESAS